MPSLKPIAKSCLSIIAANALMIHAQAATITVDSVMDDDGTGCTLREAITSINSNTLQSGCSNGGVAIGVNDTIIFSGLAGNNIGLSQGTLTVNAGKTVSIDGSDINDLILDNTGAGRVLLVSGANVSMNDLTLTGGSADSAAGVLINNSGSLTLHEVTVSGNVASSTFGGISVAGASSLTVINSDITDNRSSFTGGGIAVDGSSSATIANSFITNNRATFSGSGAGAGIFTRGQVSIQNSVIKGNSARIGAGIYTTGTAHVTVSQSEIADNSGLPFGSGAGIHSESGTITISNSTIAGNQANTGAGLTATSGTTLSLINSTVTGNSATTGGGLRIAYGTTINLSNSIVAGNSASNPGAEVNNTSNTTVFGITGVNLFGESSLTSAAAFTGFVPNASQVISTSNGNTPASLASILSARSTSVNAPNFYALPDGSPARDVAAGAVCLTSPINGEDQRGVLRAAVCDIGAIEHQLSATITVNSILDSSGGDDCTLRDAIQSGLYNRSYGGCAAGADGYENIQITAAGDIELTEALPTITSDMNLVGAGQTIDANKLGRVISIESATVGISNLTLQGGSATYGAGISTVNASLVMDRSTVTSNTATSSGGGGGVLLDGSEGKITNSTISGNLAVQSGGGGIGMALGSLSLINSTVSGNSTASGAGGGIRALSGSDIELTNSLIAGNQATGAAEIFFQTGGSGLATSLGNNLVGERSLTTAEAIIGFVPSVTDITATSDGTSPTALTDIISPLGNYGGTTMTHALMTGSPAVDAGDPSLCTANNINVDQRGEDRDSRCDIGSFELEQRSQFFVIPLPNGGSITFDL